MNRRFSTSVVLSVAVAGVVLWFAATNLAGAEPRFQPSITLRSGYAAEGIAPLSGKRPVRSLRLALESTADGARGQLILDPNEQHFSKYGRQIGGTKLAFKIYDVTLKFVEEDGKTGAKCFEVQQTQFDQTLNLVVPKKGESGYKLLLASKGIVKAVVLLEADKME